MAKKTRRTAARPRAGGSASGTADYRHKRERRKNIPPAKIAGEGIVPVIPKAKYHYSPHRPPVLRFDPAGSPDALPELLAAARTRKLTDEEADTLAQALRTHEPWLEWADKREQHQRGFFEVDPVALHIHERVSAQAMLRVAARQDVDRSLFADPELEYYEAVQFYKHDIDWTNRLILGDSLQVMSSLARRENLAGKVQMIYFDPPYGIKFASNFQPEVGNRNVKDKQEDLTREPEMVRAYRDTWHLGIHSYLSYLRDRLFLARELLADTGSVFVQIGEENLHAVRSVCEEVFGKDNFLNQISFRKTTGAGSPAGGSETLAANFDYLLWFGQNREKVRIKKLYLVKSLDDDAAYSLVRLKDGSFESLRDVLRAHDGRPPDGARVLRIAPITSQSGVDTTRFPVELGGRTFRPNVGVWKTGAVGMPRLLGAERVSAGKTTIGYRRYFDDFPAVVLNSGWTDTASSGSSDRYYVVQTNIKVIERCMLMTTDPGNLVLDPTCGSGATAYVAEQWGRRWITIDTSRVAVAIARQRLMTAKFEHYRVKDTDNGTSGGVDPHPGFVYENVPHITLGSIARNTNLDPIFDKHEPILDATLAACNKAMAGVTDAQREALTLKLAKRIAEEGWRAPTDADYRRWLTPGTTRAMIENALASAFAGTKKNATPKQAKGLVERVPTRAEVGPSSVSEDGPGWEHWQVPFDTDADWPRPLQQAVTAYRKAWREKMDEVNACIDGNAESEELVDQPEVVRGVVRVSGPFTVEAVQPPEISLSDVIDAGEPEDFGEFAGAPEGLDSFDAEDLPREVRMVDTQGDIEARNAAAYLRKMYELIRDDGVRFPNNKQMAWASEEQGQPLTPLFEDGRSDCIHAEGQWMEQGQSDVLDDKVAVVFGPQYGPVTAKMVEELVRSVNRAGYDALVIAAFSFDGPAQTVIEEVSGQRIGTKMLTVHMAHIRPDVNPGMEGLLKDPAKQKGGNDRRTAASQQLFTVFGQPRVSLEGPNADGEYVAKMEGVDIYDPVQNVIVPTKADKVAAWFLDGDYDGRTFCITQAFFPDRSAWEKLARALKGVIDEDRFAAFSGMESLPFPPGKHKTAAVKVIDPRGNEVMKVMRIG